MRSQSDDAGAPSGFCADDVAGRTQSNGARMSRMRPWALFTRTKNALVLFAVALSSLRSTRARRAKRPPR